MKKGINFILGILGGIGIYAIFYRLAFGLRTTTLTSSIPWGMWVAWYAYFVGISTGAFLLASLIYLFRIRVMKQLGRTLLFLSLCSILVALIFIWLDLGHPLRVFYVFTSPQLGSVLEWEIIFYTIFVLLLLAALWFLLRCDLDELAEKSRGFRKKILRFLSLGWRCPSETEKRRACHAQSLKSVRIIMALGIGPCLAGGTGAIFAVVSSKPYWFTAILPIIFLVSALASATGVLIFVSALRLRENSSRTLLFLRNLLLSFIVLEVFLFSAEYLIGLYGAVPDHVRVYREIAFGPFPYVFWFGQIGLATIVPLFLLTLPGLRNSRFWLGFAGLSSAIGLVAVRLNLIVPGFVIPMLEGMDKAFIEPRLSYFYSPSMWEWLLSLGLISLGVLVFFNGLDYLPLLKEDTE